MSDRPTKRGQTQASENAKNFQKMPAFRGALRSYGGVAFVGLHVRFSLFYLLEALHIIRLKNIVTEQILRTPLRHLPNDGQQAVAHRSQGVLHFWWNDLVFGTLDEAKGGQGLQFATEHAGRNFLGAAGTA